MIPGHLRAGLHRHLGILTRDLKNDDWRDPHAVQTAIAHVDDLTQHLSDLREWLAGQLEAEAEGIEIDVRDEDDDEDVALTYERPVLSWELDPLTALGSRVGYGWVLWYPSDDGVIEHHFVGGDETDVDSAVRAARLWLLRQ